ncbi:ABC transporter ATP-binding protein [bacterium]|nr:MAG: ABC transporter ATP-binding protein [bacterium]
MSTEGAPGGPVVLKLDGVSKWFEDVQVLREITLEVREGEFLTLLGPSGCGKTTTLRIIAGFEAQDQGSLHIGGRPMDRVPPNRRDVHTVFQSYALFPHLDVFENVAFSLQTKRAPAQQVRERVEAALRSVGLGGLGHRRPYQLSGGQQQRVALARALVDRPAVLLLDEPFGALDLKLRKEMQMEMKRIHRESGIAFIHVTHDQEEALVMSDRIAAMSGGRIVQLGSPRDVYRRPSSVWVANFIGNNTVIPVELLQALPDRARVRLPDGQATECARWVDIGADTPAVMLIRPEDVRLETGTATENGSRPRLTGRVTEVLFVGAYVEAVVELSFGVKLRAFGGASDLWRRLQLEVGQTVVATWSPDDAYVLPADA